MSQIFLSQGSQQGHCVRRLHGTGPQWEADRGECEHRCERGKCDEEQIDPDLVLAEVGEPLLEHQRQEEAGQDLGAGLNNPEFLQQLRPVTIEALGLGLVATVVGQGVLGRVHPGMMARSEACFEGVASR